ncbi:hypothetical protein PENTCL1PPCAC_16723 [Pristionchus entomophagus]|uniref:CUB domain-containing protein n=1 Tax=Pristionchus entomophagus TaxID=358040 RepID=A0AAV5TJT8_9BILA|nr:hypothetical protein PENTCL1PPCAC_16723 [Pristionchus entomophagus]
MDDQKTMKFIAFLALLPALGLSCQINYDVWLDGRCFRQNYQTSNTYSNTFDICNKENAHLPVIKSRDDNDQFISSLAHQFGYAFWLGLICDGKKFVWADGSELTYNNFAADYTCSNATVDRRYFYGNDQLWYEVLTGNYYGVNNVVCEAKERSASTCDSFDLLQTGQATDICYKLQQKTTTWQDAESTCNKEAAHLAVIHDPKLNDFIRRTAVSAGILGGVHIGIQNNFTTNTYKWADGSEIDYDNFKPGFPNPKLGDCSMMDTNSVAGQWVNIGCQNTPLPFVCTKPAFVASNPQPAGCPSKKQYTNGDEIFSPSFPQAPGASVCDYLLMASDTTKKAQVEILFHEMNSCCDTLTVYDGTVGSNMLGSFTGYHPTPINIIANSNAIRLHWNATSGVHVRGFHARML